MRPLRARERGQAMVEFALLFSLIILLTMGASDVALAFYQYNSLAGAARYAARWGSVVGSGSACQGPNANTDTSDWCNQNGHLAAGTLFWDECGNASLEANTEPLTSVTCTNSLGNSINTNSSGVATCPTGYNSAYAGYYRASDYINSVYSTIVGQIDQRFDTNDSGFSGYSSGLGTGFNLSNLYVCIQLPTNSAGAVQTKAGNTVQVYVYYQFHPIGISFGLTSIPLVASSQYVVEG